MEDSRLGENLRKVGGHGIRAGRVRDGVGSGEDGVAHVLPGADVHDGLDAAFPGRFQHGGQGGEVEGKDELLRAEEVQDIGHAGVERYVRRALGAEQLGHPAGRVVAEGVAVQVGQRRDDELAAQVEGLAGEAGRDRVRDARDPAVFDEEDAVPDGLVGRIQDGGAGEGKVLGGEGPGWRAGNSAAPSASRDGGGGSQMSRSSSSLSS